MINNDIRAIADPEAQEILRLQQKADMDFKSAVAYAKSKR